MKSAKAVLMQEPAFRRLLDYARRNAVMKLLVVPIFSLLDEAFPCHFRLSFYTRESRWEFQGRVGGTTRRGMTSRLWKCPSRRAGISFG
jgi:hypothetical protein